jgi:hypothetical protein
MVVHHHYGPVRDACVRVEMHCCARVCVQVWAVRSRVHVFVRARAMHWRLQACVVVRRSGATSGGRGRGIFSSRAWGTFVARTLLLVAIPRVRMHCQGPAQSHAPTRVAPNPAAHTRSQKTLRCDGMGWRCAFCVGMPAWHRSAGEDLAARRSPVLRAPPSANSCTKLFQCTVEIRSNWALKLEPVGTLGRPA